MSKRIGEIPEKPYWCPYCGRPLRQNDYIRGWRFHSPRGGAYFRAEIYECPSCKRKVRITEQEPGIPLEED